VEKRLHFLKSMWIKCARIHDHWCRKGLKQEWGWEGGRGEMVGFPRVDGGGGGKKKNPRFLGRRKERSDEVAIFWDEGGT